MKIIEPSVQLVDTINPVDILNKIELCGRDSSHLPTTLPVIVCVSLYCTGDSIIYRSIPDLLWEVHGNYKKKFRPVPVAAENAHGKFFFPSIAACANFLVGKIHYSLHTLQCYLWRRFPKIADWSFHYDDPDLVDGDRIALRALRQLGHEANRLAKLDAKKAASSSD